MTVATTSIAPATTEPHTDAPVELEDLELPQPFVEIGDGMVLAGHSLTAGGDMPSWLAVTGEGRARRLVGSCYWDGWTLTRAGGMILYQGGDLTLCAPHEAPLLLTRRASAKGIGHFSSGDQLMAEIRDTRAVIDLTTGAALWNPPDDTSIVSASGAQDTWLIVFESSSYSISPAKPSP
ncbi:MAG TPA: hypothetical protein VEB69_14060 [Acidimicrobiia bacterium]|nr:hypothetical protein [Acidimicrobiia bacterium]